MSDAVIKKIIREYTRESGVRNLNREIAGVMRHAAKEIAMENKEKISIRIKDLEEILGPGKFSRDEYQEIDVPGVAIGLAWTSVRSEERRVGKEGRIRFARN